MANGHNNIWLKYAAAAPLMDRMMKYSVPNRIAVIPALLILRLELPEITHSQQPRHNAPLIWPVSKSQLVEKCALNSVYGQPFQPPAFNVQRTQVCNIHGEH